ncbi:SAM-dependent methyltransferase [Acrocarpospora sp. B8E8]|uniref:SAM-dependent methyltransferase n=1 Tax=Acrocarpospora sp. B8E8 TaxID=3153572 RepID=UPI00325CBAA1
MEFLRCRPAHLLFPYGITRSEIRNMISGPGARPLPSMAGVYDNLLGHPNYSGDQDLQKRLTVLLPGLEEATQANRAFVLRSAKAVARMGVTQFLDLGSGLATDQSIPDVVSRVEPHARVVCVDNDPLVVAHGRAMLAGEHVAIIDADIRMVNDVLDHAELARIGFQADRPTAVIAAAVAHFLRDDDEPADLLREYLDAFPSGYLIFTHACGDDVPADHLEMAVAAYRERIGPIYPRTEAEITAFLNGLNVLEPGLVEASHWRPDDSPLEIVGAKFMAAVAGFGNQDSLTRHQEAVRR